MHAVKALFFGFFQKAGRADVGCNHGFFDEPMSIVARHRMNRYNLIFGEFEHRLVGVEIEPATFTPRLDEYFI